MLHKEIKISKYLQELHGETAPVSNLAITYLCALAAATAVVVALKPLALPWWKTALLALLFLDIGGGVAANLSEATRRYYRDHPKLRVPFLLLHVFHPALLAITLPDCQGYAAFTGAFTLLGALIVNSVRDREFQQCLAALLLVVGVCLSFLFPVSAVALYAFGPLFMVKLILGFAVNRGGSLA